MSNWFLDEELDMGNSEICGKKGDVQDRGFVVFWFAISNNFLGGT